MGNNVLLCTVQSPQIGPTRVTVPLHLPCAAQGIKTQDPGIAGPGTRTCDDGADLMLTVELLAFFSPGLRPFVEA